MNIDDVLAERRETHGDFRMHATTTQDLKDVLRGCGYLEKLDASQAEALEMIVHKIGRILAGNPDEPDHWRDIAGYATLIERQLSK